MGIEFYIASHLAPIAYWSVQKACIRTLKDGRSEPLSLAKNEWDYHVSCAPSRAQYYILPSAVLHMVGPKSTPTSGNGEALP